METSQGEIWVGSINKGLQVYDAQFQLQKSYDQVNQKAKLQIWCLVEDQFRRVWAGTNKGTLVLMQPEKNLINYLKPPGLSGPILSIATRDATGTIW
ncbi:hypothetical protein AHMF7616_01342 [Adhaeribacter pallidiroseus]|uniref:Uncharacterized protein n=1 Tax=Adhaeribacter pallidiroseus TaxID=2072847 RepID=A0A369QKG1_9BACT|nr:hypothetical protein [Adhaeribacter pallidiroseus]RDC62748.1 hypothetical protein AHMF7616_01342 [Adhaeribacter pallidiroseus]